MDQDSDRRARRAGTSLRPRSGTADADRQRPQVGTTRERRGGVVDRPRHRRALSQSDSSALTGHNGDEMTRSAVAAGFAILWVSSAYAQSAPIADHHQHLFSPAVVAAGEAAKPITVE